MAQPTTPAAASPMQSAQSAQTAQAKASQARLILQDPEAFDQAIQPSLRSSTELRLEDVPALERESAREMWENLSLEPAQAQMQQSERKRLLARAEALARESAAAKAELATLQTQIAQERDKRWNHPVIYAGAAGLIGLGALWLMERRKRVQSQDRELDAWAQPMSTSSLPYPESSPNSLHSLSKGAPTDEWRKEKSKSPLRASERARPVEPEAVSMYEMEDLPDFADDYATDLPGLPPVKPQSRVRSDIKAAPNSYQLARADDSQAEITPLVPPDWAMRSTDYDFVDSKSELELTQAFTASQETLLNKSRRVLRTMLQRKSERDAVSSSHAPTEIASTAGQTRGMTSTLMQLKELHETVQWAPDNEAQEAFEQEQLARQLQAQLREGRDANYDPDRANIELLSQTRLKPQSHEAVVEHLLELRTAVSGLSILGRPEGALVLLSDHIDAYPDTCAWAYLEHMQLCERLDLRDDFESMRKRYRTQFNRMAPYWHEPNSNVLGLDGYARAASELCASWGQGRDAALAMISAWLIGPMLGRKLVQLLAYQDLFDLYELLEFMPDSLAIDAAAHGIDREADAAKSNALLPNEEFVPTVSLLDLDYEFSSDVTLEEKEVQQAEKAVTVVKPGNFSVDFNVNVAGTQLGGLPSMPAELSKT